MSQAIIRAHNDKIALYNKSDIDCCADSGVSEDMLPDCFTFKTYCLPLNSYATLGDTTKIIIEVIGTTIYTLNGKTIITRNAIHVPALCSPLYSLRKYCQIPGWGVYSSYKYGSYLFFPDLILLVEDSYDNIFSYHPMV